MNTQKVPQENENNAINSLEKQESLTQALVSEPITTVTPEPEGVVQQVQNTPVVANHTVPENLLQAQSYSGNDNRSNFVANTPTEYIYASGILRVHFPTRGLEKESEAAAKFLNISPRDYYALFSHKDEQGNQVYRYIAEQVSWILSIDNQDVYVLLPNSDDELNEFINTLEKKEGTTLTDEVLSVAIGILGPVAPKELSNDLPLRMVMCNHLYHFTTEALLQELNVSNTTTTAIRVVLNALTTKPNIGASAFERAKNFIAYRYSTIYTKTAGTDASDDTNAEESQFLENLETKMSDNSPGRILVDIIFTYQKNVSGRQSTFFVSVDVTDQFPFLHSNLTNYIPSN